MESKHLSNQTSESFPTHLLKLHIVLIKLLHGCILTAEGNEGTHLVNVGT